jgi:DNA polymerase-4
VITEDNVHSTLDTLPARVIYGVGKVTGEALESHGIKTVADIRRQPVEVLKELVGNFAFDLIELANGRDDRPVEIPGDAKSISSEHTFAVDVLDHDKLLATLLEQVQEVAERLRKHDQQARSIHLKLRYGNFKTITRAKTLGEPSAATDVLWDAAREVFESWFLTSPGALRLLGFCASNLIKAQERQLLLFSDPADEKKQRLDSIIDTIRRRYGSDAIQRKF